MFTLSLWDLKNPDRHGKSNWSYELRDPNCKILFSGKDFHCWKKYIVDSNQGIQDLLGFLTCQYDDVDLDYFKDYTKEQLNFINRDVCEEISMLRLTEHEHKNFIDLL